ncbi:MAG: hypothetical protein JXA10_19010 [Anaerolineae bacterium]|nr:hypothetical protein [Anaerolineae bacterium]
MIFRRYPKKKKKRQPEPKPKHGLIECLPDSKSILLWSVFIIGVIIIGGLVIGSYTDQSPKLKYRASEELRLSYGIPTDWRFGAHYPSDTPIETWHSDDYAWILSITRDTPQKLFKRNLVESLDPDAAVGPFADYPKTEEFMGQKSEEFEWPAWVAHDYWEYRKYLFVVDEDWVVCWGFNVEVRKYQTDPSRDNLIDHICRSLDIQP